MNRKEYEKRILELREKLYQWYVTYEKYSKYLLRFFLAFVVLLLVSRAFPYHESLASVWVTLVLACFGACLPEGLFVIMVTMVTSLQIYYLYPLLAAAVLLGILFVYLMLLRYSPKTILAAVLIPVAIQLKLWVLPVAVTGIFFSPMAVLSVGGGSLVYYILYAVKQCEPMFRDEAAVDFMTGVQKYADHLVKNEEMYVVLFALCAMALGTNLIRTRKMAYAFEISILFATVGNLILLLVGKLMFACGFSTIQVVAGSLLSGILAYGVHFLHMVLDYGSVEEVQFEDEEYYYYVRAVPKLRVTMANKKVKRINKSKK